MIGQIQRDIGVLHRPLRIAEGADTEQVGEAEIVPADAILVVERGLEAGDEAAAPMDVALQRKTLDVG